MRKDQAELKPCPFCGKTTAGIENDGLCYVTCDECYAEGPAVETDADAIAAWNRRPETDQAEAPKVVAWVRKWFTSYGPCADEFTDNAELAELWRGHPQTREVVALADADVAALWERLVNGGWTPPMCPSNTLFKILRDGVVRAISPHNPTDGWQTIETAPKDGTWCLLYWPTMSITAYPAVGFHSGDEYGWELVNDRDYGEVFPTHWRPVPAPHNPTGENGNDG